jgi:FMN-dependent NADH-azoreductase
MKLLFVEASPRPSESFSSRVGEAFLGLLEARGGLIELDRLRLWEERLPEFNGAALEGKYARLAGEPLSRDQEAAWRGIHSLVAQIDRADTILVTTPMWNFGIPYRLKHWFDLVTQPGLSFTFNPASGYAPLLRDRPVTVILASSGDYSKGPSWGRPDLASGYLKAALAFIGLKSCSIVRVGPTVGAEADRQRGIERAMTELSAVAGKVGVCQ